MHRRGITTTDYFGSLEDVVTCGLPTGTTEIMVHPDYDQDGALIDRVEFLDGIPAGKALDTKQIAGERITYRSL